MMIQKMAIIMSFCEIFVLFCIDDCKLQDKDKNQLMS